MKLSFPRAVFLIILAFGFFVISFHKYKTTQIEHAIKENARIVATSIWELNPEGTKKYLESEALHYNYEHIVVLDTDETKFIEIIHPKLNSLESRLAGFRLIPRVNFSVDIFHNKELIGQIKFMWLNTSIFIYIYAFIVCTLLIAVVHLYNRVLKANSTLEQKVEFRTKELFERSQDLRESERRFRTLVDQATDAIFVTDFDGRLLDTNPKALDTLGYTREEILKLKVADFDADIALNNSWDHIVENSGPNSNITIESMQVRKDGTEFPVEVNITQIEVNGKPAVLGIARDITQRKHEEVQRLHLEAKLGQAQKMEAIGTLAGGIAHDFNNILSPISGYAELSLIKLPNNSEVKIFLNQILHAAHRAKELVKQILALSRQETQQPAPVEIQVIVKEALKLLRASIPTTIEIQQNTDPQCGYVLADSTQIHQILMNLCTNAYHAMRQTDGVLSVSLTPFNTATDDAANDISLQPGPYTLLEVSDTGHGMSKKTLDRIFDPYFTTKANDKGTGLGLSIVHGIVKTHGGHITVSSAPGKGSRFHIYWPVVEPDRLQDPKTPAASLPHGNETILLIDDEGATLQVAEEMLKNLGYTVHAFTKPIEACEYFQENPGMFDLIVTDMTMPKMTGVKVFQAATAIRPDMPVILCTGFSEIITEAKALEFGIKAVAMKPISFSELAKVVRSVLNEAGNRLTA